MAFGSMKNGGLIYENEELVEGGITLPGSTSWAQRGSLPLEPGSYVIQVHMGYYGINGETSNWHREGVSAYNANNQNVGAIAYASTYASSSEITHAGFIHTDVPVTLKYQYSIACTNFKSYGVQVTVYKLD